jgi:pimeloyl-ACP methyl ester carboxylesterase
LVGGKSRQYPLSAYKKVLRGITERDVKVVEGAGHLVHMDKPEETVRLIGEFLKELD